MQIKVERIGDITLPEYKSDGASGFDIKAAENVVVLPYTTALISTGLKFEIPKGYEIQIRSRSGLARSGLIVLNQPGTVDSDYRGEVKVLLHNMGTDRYGVTKGERIAQGVLCPVLRAVFVEGDLTITERGEGGFGSTGVK